MHIRSTLLVVIVASLPVAQAAEPDAAKQEFFEKKVRPLLVENCYGCHGEQKQRGGLRLDSATALKKGSDNGQVVMPGDPGKSPLIKAIRREGDSPMPPEKPLSMESRAILTEWVKLGATFPASDGDGQQKAKASASKHWAFQPVTKPTPPQKLDSKYRVQNEIDRFIAQKLQEKGWSQSAPADRRTLLRRVTVDLTGLPPTLEEIEDFEADRSPNAFEKVVDRLLASPQYGERWARYWLDLARYSDSKGYDFQQDRNFPYSYTYRDYVIRSFNEDRPYNQFIIEQLAADRLELGKDKRPLAAMGFLTLGRRFLNNPHDIIDDRIDVVSRSFLGLTVGCARCHDHKYDPIPIKDYYSLYGVFASSVEPRELPQIGEVVKSKGYEEYLEEVDRLEKAVEEFKNKRIALRRNLAGAVVGNGMITVNIERIVERADRNAIANVQRRLDGFKARSVFNPPRAMVLEDSKNPGDAVVFLRGNPGNRGPQVPRQIPAIAAGPKGQKPFKNGSGRLELAKTIASADNPLTARVMVNRIWMHHFGQGLVRTPSDFGTRSDPASHPELLDWMASQFVGPDAWSIKKLHKRILLSATYQCSSQSKPEWDTNDAENKLLARFPRRRLDFEALRDAVLFASGQLDLSEVGGRSVDLFKTPLTHRRTVYAFIERQNLPGTIRAFDFASPDQHTPQRFQTTVPQQALFMMNNRFLAEAAKATMERSEVARHSKMEAKIREVYRCVLGRDPTREEFELARSYIADGASADEGKLNPWEQWVQVLLISNEFAFVD